MPFQHEEFEWSEQEEPHKSRRLGLLKEFPEVSWPAYAMKRHAPQTSPAGTREQVKKVLGNKNWTLTPMVLGANLVQFSLAYFMRDVPLWAMLIVAYTIGGSINHAMTLAMHELSHNLASKSLLWNRVLGLLSNLPLGLPSYACVASSEPWLVVHFIHACPPSPSPQHLQAVPPGAPQVPRRRWHRRGRPHDF